MVEEVARAHHKVWLELDCFVDELSEGIVEVLSSSFQAVLRVAQMQIAGVDEAKCFHRNSFLLLSKAIAMILGLVFDVAGL